MTALEWIRFLPGAALTLGGLFFMVTAVIGNYRFPAVTYRMHAAGIGDTLGLLLTLACGGAATGLCTRKRKRSAKA